jgi:hypothetical protein
MTSRLLCPSPSVSGIRGHAVAVRARHRSQPRALTQHGDRHRHNKCHRHGRLRGLGWRPRVGPLAVGAAGPSVCKQSAGQSRVSGQSDALETESEGRSGDDTADPERARSRASSAPEAESEGCSEDDAADAGRPRRYGTMASSRSDGGRTALERREWDDESRPENARRMGSAWEGDCDSGDRCRPARDVDEPLSDRGEELAGCLYDGGGSFPAETRGRPLRPECDQIPDSCASDGTEDWDLLRLCPESIVLDAATGWRP